LNNQFYPGVTLSLSVGTATAETGMLLAHVQRDADDRMYEQKRLFYESRRGLRRED
jgi:hypothetical protein